MFLYILHLGELPDFVPHCLNSHNKRNTSSMSHGPVAQRSLVSCPESQSSDPQNQNFFFHLSWLPAFWNGKEWVILKQSNKNIKKKHNQSPL